MSAIIIIIYNRRGDRGGRGGHRRKVGDGINSAAVTCG